MSVAHTLLDLYMFVFDTFVLYFVLGQVGKAILSLAIVVCIYEWNNMTLHLALLLKLILY